MKSKITIDVDLDNQPVIKIEYSASEDVRDKLVKKFLDTFAGESQWSEFLFLNTSKEGVNSTSLLRPIPPHAFEYNSNSMKFAVDKFKNGNKPKEEVV